MTLEELTRQTLLDIGIPFSNFAKRLDISVQTLSKWLKGQLRISGRLEEKIEKNIEILARANDELNTLAIMWK